MPFTAPGQAPEKVNLASCLTEIHPPAYPNIPYCSDLQQFYSHPVIQEISQNEFWTVSGGTGEKKKVPLDAKEYALLQGRVIGAKSPTRDCLMTLRGVWEAFQPEIKNPTDHIPYAYYIDCMRDGYVCLDAEPSCSPEMREKFLKLPFLYGEFSLSGKGLHLIFKLPTEILKKYPEAQKKIKMQSSDASYEVLMCHYMTFTENMIIPAENPLDISEFHAIFEELCQAQTKQERLTSFDVDLMPLKDIPGNVSIMWMLRFTKNRKPRNAYASESHYEFGVASTIMYDLFDILYRNPVELNGHKYTATEMALLLYYKLTEMLKHRPKHDELRNGMPFLLYLAQDIISKNPSPYSKDYVPKSEYKKKKQAERMEQAKSEEPKFTSDDDLSGMDMPESDEIDLTDLSDDDL